MLYFPQMAQSIRFKQTLRSSDVTLVACLCTCVALTCPSVRGHTGTMWVMFTPRGSQMGSTNSCFHEAWTDLVWLTWHANQFKRTEVTGSDMLTLWAFPYYYTHTDILSFLPKKQLFQQCFYYLLLTLLFLYLKLTIFFSEPNHPIFELRFIQTPTILWGQS